MFKSLLQIFKADNLLAQAREEILDMLREDLSMFNDSVKLLWTNEGVSIDEMKRRDREINRNVRDVRKKALTHLAFSGRTGLDSALVLISMVVDIERIGDHTKDISYLATDYPGRFKPGDFEDDLKEFENSIKERLLMLVAVIVNEEERGKIAAGLTRTHDDIDRIYHKMIIRILTEENESLTSCQSAMLALYIRYLRRIEGHIFNLASTEVNPFHRIGFKMKNKSGN
ncbi:MAG: PhoU domain-containing protein [Gemmatimonadota bacterium]|nr:PhoU domain-containing protein [Gemmatimonadota bacterium]